MDRKTLIFFDVHILIMFFNIKKTLVAYMYEQLLSIPGKSNTRIKKTIGRNMLIFFDILMNLDI